MCPILQLSYNDVLGVVAVWVVGVGGPESVSSTLSDSPRCIFIKKRENGADQAGRVLFEPAADDEYKSIGLPDVNDPVWDANRAFLCRPRFLRTCVLQEALLAGNFS
jgi:hypothetical protein